MIIERIFESSSSDAKHKAVLDTATGAVTCSCRGFRSTKNCWHARDIATTPAPTPVKRAAVAPAASTGIPVKPMLASAMTKGSFKDFMTSAWCLEEKFDGHRVIARVSKGQVSAWSRPRAGKDALVRTLPPAIAAALSALPNGIYDGELIANGERSRSSKVTQLDLQHDLVFVVFDAPEILGTSMLRTPYTDRRAALTLAIAHLTGDHATRVLVPASVPVTKSALADIMDRGGEGAILKRVDSLYQPNRRSPDWIKVKRSGSVVMTITGFETGKSGPHSVALGIAPDGREMRVKTKDNATRDDLAKHAKSYIGKRLVVAYTERSEDGAYLNGTWDHLAGKGE